MTTPATADLVSLVRERDDDLDWEDPVPADGFRMLRLPGRDFQVVSGAGAWLVRRGEVLRERFFGYPILLVEAGPRVFFLIGAPSEDWAASLENFLPASASCVVADSSGTPLNVRNAPRRGDVIDTLENGERLRVAETRGGWGRIEGREQAWVHESALRCGE